MDRDVWILGVSMTKFQRYPDKDLIDLGSEAALVALADADVTIQDMDVMGAGNLAEAASGIGQRVQKQIGQTGIPVFNVAMRVPRVPPQCGAPTWRSRPARPRWVWPSGWRRWARWEPSACRPARTARSSSRPVATDR